MTLSKSFVRNAAMTPLDARLMSMAGIVCNADGTPRTGVMGNASASIVATTGTMNVAIAAAEFATSKGKAEGVTLFANDGTMNLLLDAAPASNSRIDVIWVKHFDDTSGDSVGQFLPLFGFSKGAAAAIPTKPGIPTGAEELATIRIYSGTTATNGGANTLANTYRMTAARGGTVPFRTKADLDLWTTPVEGQSAYVIGADATYEYIDGTVGWVHRLGKPVVSAISPAGGYGAGTSRVIEAGGRISLEGVATSVSTTFTAGAVNTLGSIPSSKAPVADRTFACTSNFSAVAAVTISTTGAVTFVLNTSFSGALSLSLSGCSWLDKRLG